ncbi:MAG: nuclear transport factor 2 family protein [Stackebrandtia sp.]
MYVTDIGAISMTDVADPGLIRELRDRAEIVDAAYRFGLGQDLRDRELLGSALAVEAVLDFGPAAAAWGARPPVMTGRDTIVTAVLGMFVDRVDTTHQVTNPRIAIETDTARLTALVEAQHVLTADRSVYALLKNRYDADLSRDGHRWLITRLRIDNSWYTGDPAAIFD